jgi:hypothetical protein
MRSILHLALLFWIEYHHRRHQNPDFTASTTKLLSIAVVDWLCMRQKVLLESGSWFIRGYCSNVTSSQIKVQGEVLGERSEGLI